MLSRRLFLVIAVVLAAAAALLAIAEPASAAKLIGCDSLLNWPCPGPMPAT